MRDTAQSGDGDAPRRLPSRRLWRAGVGLSILLVALAVLASQQGGDSDSNGGPLNVIAEAADRTQRESSGRAAIHAVVSSPGSDSFTMTGRMVYDETGRSRGTVTMPHPESSGSVEMEMINDGAAIYMRSSSFGSLPGGREWIALDFSSLEDLGAPLPANSDAAEELKLLEAVTGDPRKLGRNHVRGVPTTKYRGTIDVSEKAERFREEGADELASYVEANGTPTRVETWIDADGLVRRMRVVTTGSGEGDGSSKTTDMRIDFFDFGADVDIDLPEQSDVFDATSMAMDGLGVSSE